MQARPGAKSAARCGHCQPLWQQAKDSRRPERRTSAAITRNAQAVADWVATMGYVCPGSPGCGGQPHPADPERNPLTAEHLASFAETGDEAGPLGVLCLRGNSAGGARLASRSIG